MADISKIKTLDGTTYDLKDTEARKSISVLNQITTYEQKSGSIASFDAFATNLSIKSIIAQIEPVQDGTGDPSPDNIRLINGWTGAEVSRTSINIWDEQWENGSISYETGADVANSNLIRTKGYISIKPGTVYALTKPISSVHSIMFYDVNKIYISYYICNNSALFEQITTPDNCYYIRFRCITAYGKTYNNDISINYPVTDTEYHPYQGNKISITFPSSAGTVYGGTLDVTNGILTVDRAINTIANMGFVYQANNSRFFTEQLKNVIKAPPITEINVLCESLYARTWAANTYKYPCISVALSGNVFIYNTTYTSVEELTTAIGTSKFCYELAEPIEYKLTPQEVTTLLGTNNIWVDTGDVTVLYGAYLETTQTHTDRLGDSILSAIAPLETTYTASRAYTAGSYLFVGTKFYKVTAAIAEGGTITPDTNVTQTTVAEQLMALAAN